MRPVGHREDGHRDGHRGDGHREDDSGETLLEILLSIMIIGIAVTAVLGGVGIAAKASTQDERQIHAQALLRSWGEHIQARTTDVSYVPCATPATYGPASAWAYTSPTPPTGLEPLPSGFGATVAAVRHWNGASPGAFAATCGAARGLQRLTLAMTVPDGVYPGFTSTYEVVVRRPCAALATTTVTGC